MDFSSDNWTTSPSYRKDALHQLEKDFPYISAIDVRKLFITHKYHYKHTLQVIESALNVCRGEITRSWTKFTKYSDSLKPIIDKIETGAKLLNIHIKQSFKNTNTNEINPTLAYTDTIFLEELQWIENKRNKERELKELEHALQLKESIAIAEGAVLECGCCYSETVIFNIIQCSEGHIFCKGCLKHLVEEVVFGNGRSVLKCMNSEGSGCSGYFPDSILRIALPETVYNKYQEALARDAIQSARIPLVTCYACSFQVELSENAGIVMLCPDCNKETCRLCGEEAHIPLKCSEVEKKTQTNTRLTVEEALTEARLRTCHKCKAKFFKTEGCNKMTCE
jgi:TRIAD3 protein (E3 ubiquitin-protein ligase RNF216)